MLNINNVWMWTTFEWNRTKDGPYFLKPVKHKLIFRSHGMHLRLSSVFKMISQVISKWSKNKISDNTCQCNKDYKEQSKDIKRSWDYEEQSKDIKEGLRELTVDKLLLARDDREVCRPKSSPLFRSTQVWEIFHLVLKNNWSKLF